MYSFSTIRALNICVWLRILHVTYLSQSYLIESIHVLTLPYLLITYVVRVLFAFTTHPSCHSQWQKAATHHPPLPSYALRILIRWHTRTYHLSLRIIKSTKNLRINYHRHVYYRPTSWQLHAWQLLQACSLSANNLQATSSYQLPQACPLWANNLAATWMASSTVLIIRNFFFYTTSEYIPIQTAMLSS